MTCKLNIILDIDETLVYFIHHRYFKHSWDPLPEKEKKKYRVVESKSGLFLMRPHLEEFLEWIFEHCNVYLWTWSDIEYAEGVAKMVTGGHPKKFKGILVDEDANASSQEHGNSKDLNYLWYAKKMKCFHECNTILIDDLPGNSVNTSNAKNSITINPFGIFGEVKARTDPYEDLSKDKTLLDVLKIIKKVHEHMEGCSQDDDWKYENVFSEKHIAHMKLQKHVKLIKESPKKKNLVRAIGVGHSIHFVEDTAASGGRMFYKTAKKNKQSGGNVYVGVGGGKYTMTGSGDFVKL